MERYGYLYILKDMTISSISISLFPTSCLCEQGDFLILSLIKFSARLVNYTNSLTFNLLATDIFIFTILMNYSFTLFPKC